MGSLVDWLVVENSQSLSLKTRFYQTRVLSNESQNLAFTRLENSGWGLVSLLHFYHDECVNGWMDEMYIVFIYKDDE